VRRQVAAVAASLGMRLAATRGWVVVARRRWRRRRTKGQGQLVGVDALGALAEAGAAQVVDDLLQRRDARLSRGKGRAQLGDVATLIAAAVRMILGHVGIVADVPAPGQVKAARRSITLP
jgi:hypothetical protein